MRAPTSMPSIAGQAPFAMFMRFAAACVLIGTCIFFVWASHAPNEIAFFSSTLRDARVRESVVIDSIAYDVRDGVVTRDTITVTGSAARRALRLAYEKTLARRSPLVSLPGVDPDELNRALRVLTDTQERLALMQKTNAAATLVRTSLYPINFLHSLETAERNRHKFLESGSDVDARRYEAAIARSIHAYRADIVNFRSAFLVAVPPTVGAYASGHDLVTRSAVLGALATLDERMRSVQRMNDDRGLCTSGLVEYCRTVDLDVPVLDTVATPTISSKQSLIESNVRSIYARAFTSADINHEPTLLLSESSCADPAEPMPALFVMPLRPAHTGDAYGMPIYLGDIRLVPTERFLNVPFFAYFHDHGTTYVKQDSFFYYKCPDLAQDVSRLYAMRSVRDLVSKSPLSALGTHSAGSYRSLESRILSGQISESDVHAYLDVARGELYVEIPSTISDRIVELTLSMHDLSAGFPGMLTSMAYTEIRNIELGRVGLDTDLSLPYLFFVRNNLTMLFLAANASVGGTANSLYPKRALARADEPFVFYSTLPRTASVTEMLVHDLSFYYNLHDMAEKSGLSK